MTLKRSGAAGLEFKHCYIVIWYIGAIMSEAMWFQWLRDVRCCSSGC